MRVLPAARAHKVRPGNDSAHSGSGLCVHRRSCLLQSASAVMTYHVLDSITSKEALKGWRHGLQCSKYTMGCTCPALAPAAVWRHYGRHALNQASDCTLTHLRSQGLGSVRRMHLVNVVPINTDRHPTQGNKSPRQHVSLAFPISSANGFCLQCRCLPSSIVGWWIRDGLQSTRLRLVMHTADCRMRV